MIIRKSTAGDIDDVMDCIDIARQLMRDSGNMFQWTDGYPSRGLMQESIRNGYNFLIIENDEVVGTFDFIIAKDENYSVIESGNWLNNEEYGVVHRIASNGKAKGVARFCLDWCYTQIHNIRIDTHETNFAMQKVLQNLGYQRCGIVFMADGSPRLAYQKVEL